MEPNMRVFQPMDANYVSTMLLLEEYLLQKYLEKSEVGVWQWWVVSWLTREQLRHIFPELQNEEELKYFEERYNKSIIDISNNRFVFSLFTI